MYTKASLHNQNQTLRRTTPPRRTPVSMLTVMVACSSLRLARSEGLVRFEIFVRWWCCCLVGEASRDEAIDSLSELTSMSTPIPAAACWARLGVKPNPIDSPS